MTVAELIAKLEKMQPDCEVFMSSDPEGNSFSWVSDVSTHRTESDDPLEGEVEHLLLDKLTEDLIEQGYTEEDVGDGPLVVCIWP